ncbi:hypothetical protein EDC04DRAFT_2907195 [Pisolithus marmoratus]|nr:hypothetical protein EDC04DRAFT_2907195 [Pisolithus marmoratus]
MAHNFSPTGNASNKALEAYEHKFKTVSGLNTMFHIADVIIAQKIFYAVSDLKSVTSGFAYSDIDGAMITLESADLWEWYTKSHKEAKPFCNVRFPHFEGVEVLLPSCA